MNNENENMSLDTAMQPDDAEQADGFTTAEENEILRLANVSRNELDNANRMARNNNTNILVMLQEKIKIGIMKYTLLHGTPPSTQIVQNVAMRGLPFTVNLADKYLDQYFDKDKQIFASYASRYTGFANLDSIQPMYPGLSILGAIPSLGKSTFCQQWADQVAAQGIPVLYFSLEQTELEIETKSLSRIMYNAAQIDPTKRTYSSVQIRRGLADGTPELVDAIKEHKASVGNNLMILECSIQSTTVEDIIKYVEYYIDITNTTPVVYIDYIQIIAPSIIENSGRPFRLEGREAVDHIITSLKALQLRHNLTVVAVSSLSRQNYLIPVGIDSFKESGGLEYTADMIYGMQLAIINDDLFDKESKIKQKRALITEAKSEIPRRIELAVLKNRNGRSSFNVNFDYYPQHDVFVPDMSITVDDFIDEDDPDATAFDHLGDDDDDSDLTLIE